MKRRTILIATLGGQPQVVTFALDALLDQGEEIDEVVAVYLGAERYRQAYLRLAAEFPGDRYSGRRIHFHGVGITEQARLLPDIYHSLDAEATWATLHELLGSLKAVDAHVHLLLSGGRRLMALLAMSVAMLHFDHADRVWHIYTPPALQEQARGGRLLHGAGVELISVPLAPWGAYFPGLRSLLQASPAQILAAQGRWLDSHERGLCRLVWGRLTPQQQVVTRAFAAGDTRKQAAERLSVSIKTIDSHKSEILGQCREAWGLEEDARLSYRFIREKFEPFLLTQGERRAGEG